MRLKARRGHENGEGLGEVGGGGKVGNNVGEIRARDEAVKWHPCGERSEEEEDYGKHIMSALRMRGLQGFSSSLTSCCVCVCVCALKCRSSWTQQTPKKFQRTRNSTPARMKRQNQGDDQLSLVPLRQTGRRSVVFTGYSRCVKIPRFSWTATNAFNEPT